jgi:hypothetical protein
MAGVGTVKGVEEVFERNDIIPLAILAMVAASGCESQAVRAHAVSASAIERGKYLVTVGGCNDCHTPWIVTERGPEPDLTRALSGHPESVRVTTPPMVSEPWGWAAAGTNTAFAGPWGLSFAFNLTPDENTGIGIWTEDMFVRAIRTGRHMGVSRPILPPMPWQNYRQMTDEDLGAIYAYLRSIPPIHNRVPDIVPPEKLAELP